MHVFHDFYPQGYIIFRLSEVDSVRQNEYERLSQNADLPPRTHMCYEFIKRAHH